MLGLCEIGANVLDKSLKSWKLVPGHSIAQLSMPVKHAPSCWAARFTFLGVLSCDLLVPLIATSAPKEPLLILCCELLTATSPICP